MLVFDVIVSLHGNVKVDSNLVKSGGFAMPITGLKSEIRISKLKFPFLKGTNIL